MEGQRRRAEIDRHEVASRGLTCTSSGWINETASPWQTIALIMVTEVVSTCRREPGERRSLASNQRRLRGVSWG
jgi:hypothetical protein